MKIKAYCTKILFRNSNKKNRKTLPIKYSNLLMHTFLYILNIIYSIFIFFYYIDLKMHENNKIHYNYQPFHF